MTAWLLLALAQAELPRVPEGWKVDVVAKAPDVRHPSAVAVAPDGRVFVGEDPQDMEGPVDAKIGRVLCFHPDGRRTVVAEGLGPVFGLAWHDGRLYVHDCFRVAAYRDGAEPVEILPATHPEPSRGNRYNTHIPAGIRLAPDGFFYMAVGDKGIPGLLGPDGRTLQLRGGGVIRFRPDGTRLEVFATGLRNAMDVAITPQGHVFAFDNDDNAHWGARVIHVVEGGDYGYPWERGRPWVLPAIHEGRGIPAGCVAWNGSVYLCEWGRSEVIRYRFEPAGGTFRIAEREVVFRRGAEEFRPVCIAAGPDGRSLVVTDWNTAQRRTSAAAGRVLRFTWAGPLEAAREFPAPAPADDAFTRHAAALALRRKIEARPETLDTLPLESAGPALRGTYDVRAVALAARAGDLDLLGEFLFKPRPWDGIAWWGTRAALNPPLRPDLPWEGTEAARKALVAALDDPSLSRRRLAVRGLRTDRASAGALRKRLEAETDPDARKDLFGALVAQGDLEVERLAVRAIEASDPALFAVACLAVRSPEPVVRALEQRPDPLLLAALARTRGPAAPVIRLLEHASPDVRAAAVQALADLEAREAVPDLVRRGEEALPALVRLPDLRALDLYVAGLSGRAAETRVGCARAIGALGREARTALEARILPDAALAELQRIYAAASDGPLFRRKIERPGREALLAHALARPGSAEGGRKLFHDPALLGCSRCHFAEGRGGDIGPELDMVGAVYDRRTLAESVLFPNKIIHGAYRQTAVRLKSGDVASGLLRRETADQLILLDAEGRTHTVRKAEVDARRLSESSTMPDGLADALMPGEFSDLVAYLESLKGER